MEIPQKNQTQPNQTLNLPAMSNIREKSAQRAPEGDKMKNYLTERQFAYGRLPCDKAPFIPKNEKLISGCHGC